MGSGVVYEADRGDDMLDLRALFGAIGRRKAWIILPTLLALAGSIFIVNSITPRYTGEARILLESRDGVFTRPGGDRDPGSQAIDQEAVTSQVQLIMSRDLGRDAIRRIGLVGNSEFDPGVGVLGSAKRILVMLGFAGHPADRAPEDRVLQRYYERLLVYPVAARALSRSSSRRRIRPSPPRARMSSLRPISKCRRRPRRIRPGLPRPGLPARLTRCARRWPRLRPRWKNIAARRPADGANNTLVTSQQLADLSGQLANARTLAG